MAQFLNQAEYTRRGDINTFLCKLSILSQNTNDNILGRSIVMWHSISVHIFSVSCLLSSLHPVAGILDIKVDPPAQSRHLQQYEGPDYSSTVPLFNGGEGYIRGPVDPGVLEVPEPCLTIGEVLDLIPDASIWKQVLIDAGMKIVLLNDPKVQTTLLVPINGAFFKPLEDATYGADISELKNARPDIINSLVGASVLKGLYPSNALAPGEILPTSNTIDKVNPLTLEVVGSPEGLRIQAQGSSAAIITQNIAACGPSVIHLIDTVLLPFRFDDEPRDAVTGTHSGYTPQNGVQPPPVEQQPRPVQQPQPVQPPPPMEPQQPFQPVPAPRMPVEDEVPSSSFFGRLPFGQFFG